MLRVDVPAHDPGQPGQIRGCELDLLDPSYGHPEALGFLRVDVGEPASGSTLGGEPAARRDRPECGEADRSPDVVEDQIRPVPSGRLG
jgi:hypothetical protein